MNWKRWAWLVFIISGWFVAGFATRAVFWPAAEVYPYFVPQKQDIDTGLGFPNHKAFSLIVDGEEICSMPLPKFREFVPQWCAMVKP